MRTTGLLAVALTLLYLPGSCVPLGSTTAGPEPTPGVTKRVILTPTHAPIREGGARGAEAATARIDGLKDAKAAQFVDANNGWVANGQALYKTADGGKSWERLAPALPAATRITSFFFADAARGWLTAVTRKEHERYGFGNSSLVVATSDGGRTWAEQASFPDEVEIRRVKFLNGAEGLLVGARVVGPGSPQYEAFAARTSDGGKTWADISEKLKPAAPGDVIQDVIWPSPSRLLMLTGSGSLVGGDARGHGWAQVVAFEDRRPGGSVSSTGYYKLALDTRGRVRVVAGAEGEEGFWGDLITTLDGDVWSSRELIRTPLRDVVFLSDKELVACGRHLSPRDEKTEAAARFGGIVLHSTDGGQSWTTLYLSERDETFISLTKIDDGQLYAVSDAGTFLRLDLK